MPDSGTREPVSCYVCGHPVLEGQRLQFDREFDTTKPPFKVQHLNPADHLPTLTAERTFRRISAPWVRDERLRCARLVEDEFALKLNHIHIDDSEVVTVSYGALKKLAQRIRSGE